MERNQELWSRKDALVKRGRESKEGKINTIWGDAYIEIGVSCDTSQVNGEGTGEMVYEYCVGGRPFMLANALYLLVKNDPLFKVGLEMFAEKYLKDGEVVLEEEKQDE